MRHNISVKYKDVGLSPLSEEDLEDLRTLRNQKKDFFLNKSFISKESQKKWFDGYLARKGDYAFRIECGGFAGSLSLIERDQGSGVYEFGRFMICDSTSGQGVGSLAMAMACSIAFSAFGALQLELEVLESNAHAIRLYERMGFTIENREHRNDDNIFTMRSSPDAFLKGYLDVYSSVEAQIQGRRMSRSN